MNKNKSSQTTLSYLNIFFCVFFGFFTVSQISGQSLFVIADINAKNNTPIHAYDMAGTELIFQAEYGVPNHGHGAVGIAVDPINGFLFITYEDSDIIQLIDAQTMTGEGTATAQGSNDLAGIAYNTFKNELYVVDRSTPNLYSYEWIPETISLNFKEMINLQGSSAWGISLDETSEKLYVANKNTITVFDINTWNIINTINPDHSAINVAIDVRNQILYSGGGFDGNYYIDKLWIETGQKQSKQLYSDGGVMGLVVNPGNGLVYCSTGQGDGSDNLLVLNENLNKVFESDRIGDPTGIATGTAYNPLSFDFTGIPDCMYEGDTLDLSIAYQNILTYAVENVDINISLPDGTGFISCSNNCNYSAGTNTLQWALGTVEPLPSPQILEFNVSINSSFITPSIFEAQINGSMGQTTITKEITQPFLNLGPADTTICPIDSISLYAGGPENDYQWSTGETSNSIIVGTSGVGSPVKTIWAIAEDGNGCISTDTITVIFDWTACTAIDEIIREYFNIYPNPVIDGKLFINVKKHMSNLKISLYDEKGTVRERFPYEYADFIDVSMFPEGMYFLNLKSDEFDWFVKIMIK